MKKFHGVLAASTAVLVAFAGQPGTARAQQVVASDPELIERVLRVAGHEAELGKADDGDPVIHAKGEGYNYDVYFYGCTEGGNCDSIQFYAGWTKADHRTLADINSWNAKHRFGRAYLDGDKDPAVEFDLDLASGGISPGLFSEELDLWMSILDAFSAHIYDS